MVQEIFNQGGLFFFHLAFFVDLNLFYLRLLDQRYATSIFSELFLFVAVDTVVLKVNVEVNEALRLDSVASD